MKIQELLPFPEAKVTFKLSSFKQVPKVAGCYALTTFENNILYIGLSDNLYSRFQQHLQNSEKVLPTKDGKVVWFYYMEFNRTNLPKLERTWINSFLAKHGTLPILNKINSPI